MMHAAFVRNIAGTWRLRSRSAAQAYPSYADALRLCGDGYESDDLARTVLAKTVAALEQDISVMVAQHSTMATLLAVLEASAVCPDPVRVLDFGGAFGVAYFLIRQKGIPTARWAVVESSSFTRHRRSLESDSLRFFDRVSDAVAWLGEVDLLYSSSALQYTPNPERSLGELIAMTPRVLGLLRCALSRGDRIITIQSSRLSENGPGPLPDGFIDREVRYPITFMRDADLLKATRHYRLLIHSDLAVQRQTIAGQPLVSGEAFIWRA